MEIPKYHFKDLDGIRTVAFLTVFASHVFLFNSPNLTSNQFVFLKNNIFRNGDLGVNLFFTLSGFLITYLLLKEKLNTSKINIKNFYIRRILRIWPLYFITLLSSILIIYLIPHFNNQISQPFANCDLSLIHIHYYFLFCANFALIAHESVMPFLGVLWSISVEEQFYLLWPIIIFVVPTKHLLKLFLLIIIGSTIFRYANYSNVALLNYHTLSAATYLIFGAIVAFLSLHKSIFVKWFSHMPKFWIILIYSFMILFILGRKLLAARLNDSSIFPLFIVADQLLIAVFFSFIIAEQNFASHSFFKFSNFKTISRMGIYTYGSYCYHILFLYFTLIIIEVFQFNQLDYGYFHFAISSGVALVLTFVFSKLSYSKLELKFLQLKEKFN